MAPSFTQIVLFSAGALAAQSGGFAAAACRDIELAIPDRVESPISIAYLAEVHSYWSLRLRESNPACVVFPQSAEDVAAAVTVLNQHPGVNFTVKSGGHDPNPGHASVDGGVLISMAELTGATYDSETGLAKVLPGGEWNDVIGDLDKHDVTVTGGRLGGCSSLCLLLFLS
jgi:FAD/FMN-containing dehydrogenase